MKILLTGGGSGGHFYPLIAIAEELRRISKEERLITPQLYYMAPEPYDERLLFDNEITYLPVTSGKLRRYFSFRNATDLMKTAWGILQAIVDVFRIFPDIVVGKGGYGSLPALVAARLFNIPVLIHESDTVPGRVNQWAGKFARRISVSFSEAGAYFPSDKVAHTGNPIRRALLEGVGDASLLHLSGETKVIALFGGSLGAVHLNDALITILPKLLDHYEVIHQTGKNNFEDIRARTGVLLDHHPFAGRYHPFPYLSTEMMRATGLVSDLIISRAGSTIFEIASFGKPSILIPIAESNGDHQRENAYVYMQHGATLVIEEENLQPAILLDEVVKILDNRERYKHLKDAALRFAKNDAAEVIAREILEMALKHEK